MSDFVSLKDLFGSSEFKGKVKEGKVEKDRQRASYTPELWEKAKEGMDRQNFPEHLFVAVVKPRKDYGFEGHKHEGQHHSLDSYVHNIRHNWLFETEWRLAYCPACQKVYHKLGTVMNKVENLSYTRWFTRGGKDMEHTPVVKKERTLDLDNALPGSFESVLKS